MTCDFCGCELQVLVASDDAEALFDNFKRIDVEPCGHVCLDLDERCVYEFYYTEFVPLLDGYKHLCKKCATGLDAFGKAILERDCRRRVLNYKNASVNALNKLRGTELHPYTVTIDISVKDQPVAQVCRKDGDRVVLTNTIRGDAVGHLITYMEGSVHG